MTLTQEKSERKESEDSANVRTLRMVRESKIRDLMPPDEQSNRWEASGVLVKDGHYYVVFDDRTEVARLSSDLQPDDSNRLQGMAHTNYGYEGIAYDSTGELFYLLVEARERSNGSYQASIVEYDNDFTFLNERPVDFTFESENKGFEAIGHMRRDDRDYLLALCEGNKCKCGAKGRKPGGGRVHLFEKRKKRWKHVQVIALPKLLPFVDYSGMSINNGRVAVVSQVNSLLWVGQFDEADWEWHNEGELYEFPRTDDGAIRYGNIEGVAWITPTRIVTVSDRRSRRNQPDKGLSEKDQSIHIFEIPA